VTVVENVYMKVSFVEPDNQGAEITMYRVLVLANDAITWLESNYCLHTDPALVDALSCYIPMSELFGSRFDLPYNRIITVKVQAYNRRGWSQLSASNTVGA